ncbi:MAG: flagellar biosynthetic protein FliO [Oscillospiraceae bacterium]|nr:flagellar biosynthetic protein FliO [Oscillospiraceae bacterium]
MPPDRVILFIIGTVAILFGAYYVTYYVGKKASGQTRAGIRNRNIALIDRFAISRDKSFCVVEIADKVYIVGVTNNSMTLLDTLDAAEFAKFTEKNDDRQISWKNTPVGQYGNKLTKKVVAFFAAKKGKLPEDSGTADFAETFDKAKRNADSAEEPDGTGDTGENE